MNELVTNAFKCAFPAEVGGAVDVTVEQEGGDLLRIEVRDDGVGCPPQALGGVGSRLVRLLAQQYGGSVDRLAAGPGCRVVVSISLDQAKGPVELGCRFRPSGAAPALRA